MGQRLSPPPPHQTTDKAAWRRWAREVRRRVREDRGDALDAAVCERLLSWDRYADAATVAVYLAFGSEIDLGRVVLAATAAGKLVAAPRAGPAGRLTLHALVPGAALEVHRFGQREPLASSPLVDPEALDLVLVPGLAFDAAGHRLGHGLGYYDRLLPLLRPGAVTVGVTPADLVVAGLPVEPHDAAVTHLLTEERLTEVG